VNINLTAINNSPPLIIHANNKYQYLNKQNNTDLYRVIQPKSGKKKKKEERRKNGKRFS